MNETTPNTKNNSQPENTAAKEQKPQKEGIPVVHTFKSDTSEYVKEKGLSMVEVMAAESKRKKVLPTIDPYAPKKGKGKQVIRTLSIAVISLIIFGGIAGYFLWRQKQPVGPTTSPLPKPLIIADDEQTIAPNEILTVVTSKIPAGTLKYFPIVFGEEENKILITTAEFFTITDIGGEGIADGLEDRFMSLLYKTSKTWPILLFKIKNYERTFSSAIQWEKTMADELAALFDIENLGTIRKPFYDREISNHDVRIIDDTFGRPALFYAFFGRKYLIITTGEDAVKETLRRLSSTQYLVE